MVMLALVSLVISLFLAASAKGVMKVSPKARIVGGDTATPTQFPYVALISTYIKSIGWGTCTGSIISENYILTAAHCTKENPFVQVYLGSIDYQEGLFFDINVKRDIKNHEDYNRHSRKHDISLIKIQKISFKENIKPIRLPISPETDSKNVYLEETVIAVGWGMTDADASNEATKLQYIQEVVVPNIVCKSSFKAVPENNICVSRSDGKGPFKGDSGGPLVLPSESVEGPILIGVAIASNIKGCNGDFPALYVRVESYLEWIKTNTKL